MLIMDPENFIIEIRNFVGGRPAKRRLHKHLLLMLVFMKANKVVYTGGLYETYEFLRADGSTMVLASGKNDSKSFLRLCQCKEASDDGNGNVGSASAKALSKR